MTDDPRFTLDDLAALANEYEEDLGQGELPHARDFLSWLADRVRPNQYEDVEDDEGNLYEAPDDDGRIRVRDLYGNLVAWYDPDDADYEGVLSRFRKDS